MSVLARTMTLFALAAGAAATTAGRSEAAFATGTFGFAAFGTVTYSGPTVASSTEVSIVPAPPPPGDGTNNVNVQTVNFPPASDDFTALFNQRGVVTTIPVSGVNTGSVVSAPFILTIGEFSFEVFSGVFSSPLTPTPNPDTLAFNNGVGFILDAPAAYTPGNLITVSFSVIQNRDEAGNPTTVNMSGVITAFNTPGGPPVPEPASVALAGVGLAGLAACRRARRAPAVG